MIVENFCWDSDNHSVNWEYNGKTIFKKLENAHFASVNIERKFIYVEAGYNFSQDQIYEYSFDGNLIFKVDTTSDKIVWKYKNQLIEIKEKSIKSAQIYFEQSILMLIVGQNQGDLKLRGYALDGLFLFEKAPKSGFDFMYLSSINNSPSVVCDGGKNNMDAFGRSIWHFAINPQTGELIKKNLAY